MGFWFPSMVANQVYLPIRDCQKFFKKNKEVLRWQIIVKYREFLLCTYCWRLLLITLQSGTQSGTAYAIGIFTSLTITIGDIFCFNLFLYDWRFACHTAEYAPLTLDVCIRYTRLWCPKHRSARLRDWLSKTWFLLVFKPKYSTTTEIRTYRVPKIPLPDYHGVRLSGVTIY